MKLPLEEIKFRILREIFLVYVTPWVPLFGPAFWPAIANIQIYMSKELLLIQIKIVLKKGRLLLFLNQ